MKTLVSSLAVALALSFTGPAFAGDVTTAKTAADCAKAGGIWNADSTMKSYLGSTGFRPLLQPLVIQTSSMNSSKESS